MIKVKDRSRVIKYIKKAAEIQRAIKECLKNKDRRGYSKLLLERAELKNKLREAGASDHFIDSTFKFLRRSAGRSGIVVKTLILKPKRVGKREKMFSIEFIKYWKLSAFKKEEYVKVISCLRTISIAQEILNSLDSCPYYIGSKKLLVDKINGLKVTLEKLGGTEEFIQKTLELLKKDPRYCIDMVELIKKGNFNSKLN